MEIEESKTAEESEPGSKQNIKGNRFSIFPYNIVFIVRKRSLLEKYVSMYNLHGHLYFYYYGNYKLEPNQGWIPPLRVYTMYFCMYFLPGFTHMAKMQKITNLYVLRGHSQRTPSGKTLDPRPLVRLCLNLVTPSGLPA